MAHVKKWLRKDGTPAYVVKWRDPEGAFREKTFRTKKEADAHASLVEADKARGVYMDDRLGLRTFAEVADEWINSFTDLKPRTEVEYRRILKARLLPRFGHRAVGTLRRADSASFIKALAAEGLSSATIHRVYGEYKAVMLYALDEGYIANPNVISKKVKVPTDAKLGRREFAPRFLTVAELDYLAECAAVFHPDYGLLVRFLGMSGLRVGECAALTVGDVVTYLDGRTEVRVTKSAHVATGQGRVVSSPKTDSSARNVLLPPSLAADMRAYLDRHPARTTDSAGDSFLPPDAPLWCGRVPGSHYSADWIPKYGTTYAGMTEEQRAEWLAEDPMRKHARHIDGYRPMDGTRPWDHGTFYKKIWLRAVAVAGMDGLRLHDLRHTAASLMLASGMTMLEVSEQLGHADSSITARVYAHVLPSEAVRSSERYDAWVAAERVRAAEEAASANVVSLRSVGRHA